MAANLQTPLQIYRQKLPINLAGSDMEEALQLAQGAGFQQAVARVHYLAGNFLQALHCTIGTTSAPGDHPLCHYILAVTAVFPAAVPSCCNPNSSTS